MSNSEPDVLGTVGCRDNNARRFAIITAGDTEKYDVIF